VEGSETEKGMTLISKRREGLDRNPHGVQAAYREQGIFTTVGLKTQKTPFWPRIGFPSKRRSKRFKLRGGDCEKQVTKDRGD